MRPPSLKTSACERMAIRMDEKTAGQLVKRARAARENAYAPYSRFRVGAALLCEDGSIFTGCNVENASFGAALCAERGAVTSAVAAGHTKFSALCVAVDGEPVTPCGICRQVLCEFAPGLPILCAGTDRVMETTLGALLPSAFDSFAPQGSGLPSRPGEPDAAPRPKK